MKTVSEQILTHVAAKGRGQWVCSAKDFLGLAGRGAVDQALSRLARNGDLRRIGHGLYDLPRHSPLLDREAPVQLDAALAAVARRDGIRMLPGGMAAANQLGLTNAVPARIEFATDGNSRTLNLGGRTIHLRHAAPSVMIWAGREAAPAVQALRWLGRDLASDPQVLGMLRRRLPDTVRQELVAFRTQLPAWLSLLVEQLDSPRHAA